MRIAINQKNDFELIGNGKAMPNDFGNVSCSLHGQFFRDIGILNFG